MTADSILVLLVYSSLLLELPDVLFVGTLLCLVTLFVFPHRCLKPLLKLEDPWLFHGARRVSFVLGVGLPLTLKFRDQSRHRVRHDAVRRGRVNCSGVLVWREQKLRCQSLIITRGVFLISTFALDLHSRLRIRFWAMSPLLLRGRLRLHIR